jgi:hypothetical protein
MKKLLVIAMLVLSLLGAGCSKSGSCNCPGPQSNPACGGC